MEESTKSRVMVTFRLLAYLDIIYAEMHLLLSVSGFVELTFG